MPSDELKVSFGIFSATVPPATITQTLGIPPDWEWEKDSLSPYGVKRKTHYWAIGEKATGAGDIVPFVDQVIARLVPVRDQLLGLAKTCEFELSCVIYINEGPAAPGIHFDTAVLAFLIGIGAEIDVDVYCLCDQEDT